MHYVGLDIHSKHISICVLNETGQLVNRARVRAVQQMMQILAGLPDRFEVCYEASCGYGHYHDLLRPVASRVATSLPLAMKPARAAAIAFCQSAGNGPPSKSLPR